MQIPGKHHTPSAVGAAVEYRRRKIIIPSYLPDDRFDWSLSQSSSSGKFGINIRKF